jgi:hypothetical protein
LYGTGFATLVFRCCLSCHLMALRWSKMLFAAIIVSAMGELDMVHIQTTRLRMKQYVAPLLEVLSHRQLSGGALQPAFLSLAYGMLAFGWSLGGLALIVWAVLQSVIWAVVAVIVVPILWMTGLAVLRLVFELINRVVMLSSDLNAIAQMRQSIDQIAKMTEPVASIGSSVGEMSTDIKTIAQMYSSVYKISSVTDNLQTIAGMYDAIQKIADVTDNIEAIADMRQTIDDISALRAHIEIIATMQPSIEKIATLTDHIEIIADMRESIDKISEIGLMVSRLKRAPFMRGTGSTPSKGED